MIKKNYATKLLDPRWQRKRLEILQRDNFTCVKCGDMEETLHVHHIKYVNEPWDAPSQYLETLCKTCHLIISENGGMICGDKMFKMQSFNHTFLMAITNESYTGTGDKAIIMYSIDKHKESLSSAIILEKDSVNAMAEFIKLYLNS